MILNPLLSLLHGRWTCGCLVLIGTESYEITHMYIYIYVYIYICIYIYIVYRFLAQTGPKMLFFFGRVPNFGESWGQVLEGISRLLRAWVWREDLLLQTKLCAHFRWMHSHFKQLRYTDAKLLVVYKGPLLVQRVHAQHVLWWHFGSRQQPQVPALGESEGLVLQFSNTFPHFKEVHREVPSGIPWCHGTLWPGGALKHPETSDHSDLPGGVSLSGFGILSTRGLIINQIFSPHFLHISFKNWDFLSQCFGYHSSNSK